MRTLEQIIAKEQKSAITNGAYGLDACKESIRFSKTRFNKSYYQLLEEYVDRYNSDVLFNGTMVLACWQLINA